MPKKKWWTEGDGSSKPDDLSFMKWFLAMVPQPCIITRTHVVNWLGELYTMSHLDLDVMEKKMLTFVIDAMDADPPPREPKED